MHQDQWLEDAMTQWEVPLLRTCYLLLRDAALAEDAVQETFLKARPRGVSSGGLGKDLADADRRQYLPGHDA